MGVAVLQFVGVTLIALLTVASLRVLVDLVRDGPEAVRRCRERGDEARMLAAFYADLTTLEVKDV